MLNTQSGNYFVPKPEIDEPTLLNILAANGDETPASLHYKKKIRVEQNIREKNQTR